VPEETTTTIEVWADSFHEGDWACDQLARIVLEQGGSHQVRYVDGFQPVHSLGLGSLNLELIVFGSYRAWDPIPESIEELLDWGKPDFVFYDPDSADLIFAVEETAATPTGNQALQRCERQYGASRQGVPFWYLLSEYGRHLDGNLRRDSVWPTIMALKLSQDRQIPSIVLHYSDLEHPEDYDAGTGLHSLFLTLLALLRNQSIDHDPLEGVAPLLEPQFASMLDFVTSQWRQQIDHLPGADAMTSELAADYAAAATGDPIAGDIVWSKTFLRWPLFSQLPLEVQALNQPRELIKFDPLCELAEQDIAASHAYGLSGSNTGSRPQPPARVEDWVSKQRALFERSPALDPPAEFTISINDFPVSQSGLLHVTTAKRITYLYDSWSRLADTIVGAYPRLMGLLPDFPDHQPALLYVSNSITPGRIFGDPFTGQIAAFAVAFGKLDPVPRLVIAYFPHQVHSQAVAKGNRRSSKGITIMRELTDLLLFQGGVGVSLKDDSVL
jgi:hypothetical protein